MLVDKQLAVNRKAVPIEDTLGKLRASHLQLLKLRSDLVKRGCCLLLVASRGIGSIGSVRFKIMHLSRQIYRWRRHWLLASCFAAWYRQYRISQDQDKSLSRQLLWWRRRVGVTVHPDGTVTDER